MNKKILYGIWLCLWIVVIWGHSLQPAVASENESATWLVFINGIIGKFGGEVSMHFVRKLAHFTEFFILGLLVANEFRMITKKLKRYIVLPFLFTLGVAIIDETIQLFVEGRSGQISDVCLDFSGAFVGVAIFLFIIYNVGSKFDSEA